MEEKRGPALRIARLSYPLQDRWRSYRVMIDGVQAGKIRNGKTGDFPVTPGEHAVHLAIDWKQSNSVTVKVHDNEIVHLMASPAAVGQSALAKLPGRSHWIELTAL